MFSRHHQTTSRENGDHTRITIHFLHANITLQILFFLLLHSIHKCQYRLPSSTFPLKEVIRLPVRSINISTSKRPISWGLQGENNATQLIIDVKDFYSAWPDGTPALCITRQDGHPYLAATQQWTLDTTTTDIIFTLSSIETELLGRIELVVSWSRANGSIAKSKSFLGFISGNPSSSLPLTPSTIIALDNLKEAVKKAESAADRAEAAAKQFDGSTIVLTLATLPSIGETNHLYVDKSTSKMWIWDAEALRYVEVGGGGTTEWDIISGGNAFTV